MHGSVMMYATLVSSNPFWKKSAKLVSQAGSQPTSITRAPGADARAKAAAAALLTALIVLIRTDLPAAQDPPGPWREAPEYVRLFAPAAQRDAYRAYVSSEGFDDTLKRLRADPAVLRPSGAWEPQAMIPYDAFGLTGSYNRWKVAGLYRSRRARVARGPRLDQGQLESWTLVAPYPDGALQRLEPGTLIIVLRIPPADVP
jgi:hypothetical protein